MNTEDAYQWGLATGEMMERERIIKFIELELSRECPSDDAFCVSCHAMNELSIELLRFIKGEEQ